MASDRAAQVRRIFDACLDLPPERRVAHVAEACADDAEMRAEVEGLLAELDASDRIPGFDTGAFAERGALDITRTLAGRRVASYEIRRELGSGGMGTVYEAEQEKPQRLVALKMMRFQIASPKAVQRFLYESELLGRLNHPNIARVFEAGVHRVGDDELSVEIPYIAMEFVASARTLLDHVRSAELDLRARLGLFLEICDAVHHGHLNGVIHRDLKPANILIGDDGRPKVIDFGVARATAYDAAVTSPLTSAGEFVGTIPYTSPEQLGAGVIDTRSDVWALGVILYQLLCNRRPFDVEGESAVRAAHRVLEADPIPPRTLNPALSPDLVAILGKALEKDPDARYASVPALAEDCRRYLRHEPVSVSTRGAAYRFGKFVVRRRTVVLSVTAVVLALVAGLVATLFMYGRAETARRQAEAEKKEVLRLADARTLRTLQAEAETELWPAFGADLAQMEAWCDRVRRLLERLSQHKAALAALSDRGRPHPPLKDGHSSEASRLKASLDQYRQTRRHLLAQFDELKRGGITTKEQSRVTELKTGIAQAEYHVLSHRKLLNAPWPSALRFDDPGDQWRYDHLTSLVSGLEALGTADPNRSALAAVTERMRHLEEPWGPGADPKAVETAWGRAIRAIRDSTHYGGLNLEIQRDLVPLGENPHGLWEFWHVASGARPVPVGAAASPCHWKIEKETGIILVLIPGGVFRMGAVRSAGPGAETTNIDGQARLDEGPVHEVTLGPFFLSKFEMTQGQWARCVRRWYARAWMHKNGSYYKPGSSGAVFWDRSFTFAHPAEQVMYSNACHAMRRLGLRLPTEAQWEYAARAGTSTIWWSGDTVDDLRGKTNLADGSCRQTPGYRGYALEAWDDGFPYHAPVGSFPPNPWGLHDMIGNVTEWCIDGYAKYTTPVYPGTGRRLCPEPRSYVRRGGSYVTTAIRARSAYRPSGGVATASTGFRPARAVE